MKWNELKEIEECEELNRVSYFIHFYIIKDYRGIEIYFLKDH